jgi:hypothetical protein
MKLLLIWVVYFLPLFCFAQNDFTPVDRNTVEKEVTTAGQPGYYPTLLHRFNSFDTTLTNTDYRLLYYGFAFQKAYEGYATHKKKEILTALQNKDYKMMISLCDDVLKEIPISLVANYYKGLALFHQNENDRVVMMYRDRYRGLRNAILSSGNGLTCATAFKVLYVGDEYDIMYNYFEIDGYKMQSLQYPCDKFEITPSTYFKASRIHFDAAEPMLNFEKELKKKDNVQSYLLLY